MSLRSCVVIFYGYKSGFLLYTSGRLMAIFIQLTSLMFLAGYAIKDSESTTWKFANIGIVIGSMLGGAVLAFVIGYIVHDEEFGMAEAMPLSAMTGLIAAFGAIAGSTCDAGGIRKSNKDQQIP